MYDPRNVFVAFWDEYKDCKFVIEKDGESGVLWFERSFTNMEKNKKKT